MKRVLLLILTILLSLDYALCNGFNFVDNGIYYSFTTFTDKGGEVQVETGLWAEVNEYSAIYCKTPTYVDSLYIPEYVEYQGLKFKVTSIGDAAFASCDIKYIELPNSLKSIGLHAFATCKLLEKIVIPSSVTDIKKEAFSDCSNLKEVQLHDGLQFIGKWAFSDCRSLLSIKIPNTVTYLGGQAFNNCRSLTSVEIPNSVTNIEGNPFYWCTSLSSVTIGCTTITSQLGFPGCNIKELTLSKDVKEIKGLFFKNLQTIETVYSLNPNPPSVEFYWNEPSGNCVLYVPSGSGTSYKKDRYWGKYKTILETTQYSKEDYSDKIIGKWELISSAGYSHSHVEYKTDGTFIYYDGSEAEDHGDYILEDDFLYQRYSDETDYIKRKITYLDETDLELVLYKSNSEDVLSYVKTDSEFSNIANKVLNGINYKIVKKNRTAEVIKPKSGKYYGNIVIPETITFEGTECEVVSIGKEAFMQCNSLYSIHLPQNLKYIHKNAFSYCTNLNAVTIPERVKFIGNAAFSACNISKISIPKSVNFGLNGQTFLSCNNLRSIIVEEGNLSYDSRNNCNAIIKKESKSLIAGCSTTIIPDDIIEIGRSAFNGNKSLTSVLIPNSVLYIRHSAFSGCSNISSLQISNSINEVEDYAFRGCGKLSTVFIPSSIKSIGDYAFYECNNIVSFSIGRNIEKIGKSILGNADRLKNVYCYAENIPTTDNSFDENAIYATLHVPASSLFLYKNTNPWNTFGNIVELTEEEIKADINPLKIINDFKERYSIEGKKLHTPMRGINVIKMKDGTTKKVIIK